MFQVRSLTKHLIYCFRKNLIFPVFVNICERRPRCPPVPGRLLKTHYYETLTEFLRRDMHVKTYKQYC